MSDMQFQDYKQKFMGFLNSEIDGTTYKDRLFNNISSKGEIIRRLTINIDHIHHFDVNLAQAIMNHPIQLIPMLEKMIDELARGYDSKLKTKIRDQPFHLSLIGNFGSHTLTPRSLTATHIGSLVNIEGIVTRVSLIRPKMQTIIQSNPENNDYFKREFVDSVSLSDSPPMSIVYPTEFNGTRLQTEYGYSTYHNHQVISIQEMPECAPFGQLPRAIDVVLDDDLVDATKPGDRIVVTGIYKGVSPSGSIVSGNLRTIIIANTVSLIHSLTSQSLEVSDLANIRKLSKNGDVFDLLTRSVAPSLTGLNEVKQAIILQLMGGRERVLENNMHLRGDINILLVGDPSCGKSQLLRFVLHLAPLAINTTGRGSSGVGLTAAVVKDSETSERRLEAGAMVLADRGIVCIDEFDKMSESDRVTIHEVMEQQTVTIAKAGIHCSLNARCSVIAAANPVYGQYDISKRPQDNVGLPDSLLSRFDLLFIIRDTLDSTTDSTIAEHVLSMHRYVRPGHENMPEMAGNLERVAVSEEDEGMYSKQFGNAKQKSSRVLSMSFLKKYITYAKSLPQPELTDEAIESITEEYTSLRQASDSKTLPVTARLLETLIRLSTAHAKARLSGKVESVDAKKAREIVRFALYNDAEQVKSSKTTHSLSTQSLTHSPANQRTEAVMEFSDEESAAKRHRKVAHSPTDETVDETATGMGEDEMETVETVETVEIGEEELKQFRKRMSELYRQKSTDRLKESEIEEFMMTKYKIEKPRVSELLKKLRNSNQVFYDKGMWYRV